MTGGRATNLILTFAGRGRKLSALTQLQRQAVCAETLCDEATGEKGSGLVG